MLFMTEQFEMYCTAWAKNRSPCLKDSILSLLSLTALLVYLDRPRLSVFCNLRQDRRGRGNALLMAQTD